MTKEIALKNEEVLAQLQESYPVEPKANKILLPRLGFFSQDQMEGKGKEKKVVTEAGTFYTETQGDEVNEDGKKVWVKTELGSEVKLIVMYSRKQLSYYDEATQEFTSSPVFDSEDEILPLWRKGTEVDRGTAAELQARPEYAGQTAAGKPKSKLQMTRILYVLMDGEAYQMNLRGSSMYAFLTYTRTVLPPSVMTTINSEAKEKGSIAWNQMTFSAEPLDAKALNDVLGRVQEIKEVIALEKSQFVKKEEKELRTWGSSK